MVKTVYSLFRSLNQLSRMKFKKHLFPMLPVSESATRIGTSAGFGSLTKLKLQSSQSRKTLNRTFYSVLICE